MMDWIKVSDRTPDVGADGCSEFVLAYEGHRFLPHVVQYSNGEYCKKGWYTRRMGEYIPFYKGKGEKKRLTFTHWAKIEYPDESYEY
jgi:hypothetical protein